jgi:hypothetical protein
VATAFLEVPSLKVRKWRKGGCGFIREALPEEPLLSPEWREKMTKGGWKGHRSLWMSPSQGGLLKQLLKSPQLHLSFTPSLKLPSPSPHKACCLRVYCDILFMVFVHLFPPHLEYDLSKARSLVSLYSRHSEQFLVCSPCVCWMTSYVIDWFSAFLCQAPCSPLGTFLSFSFSVLFEIASP